MRGIWIAPVFAATPALAHHEVVLATTALPALGGLAVIVSTGAIAIWRGWRGK